MNGPIEGTLTPNALLIVSALAALHSRDGPSPKTDAVGWRCGQNAAWVRRHGMVLHGDSDGDGRFAHLSTNGHCGLWRDGLALAHLLREATPGYPPATTCRYCGRVYVGEHAGRQIYVCGAVEQWCPDRVPGLPKAEFNPRGRKAQHEGIWFSAAPCNDRSPRGAYPKPRNTTWDGTPLAPGLLVRASHDSREKRSRGDAWGEVVFAGGGVALVSWPPVGDCSSDPAAIMLGSHLIAPGALDLTGLSDAQREVAAAHRDGQTRIRRDADGKWSGTAHGRAVQPRTLEILAARGVFTGEPT